MKGKCNKMNMGSWIVIGFALGTVAGLIWGDITLGGIFGISFGIIAGSIASNK